VRLTNATFLLATILGACVPLPHSGSLIPEVDGTLTLAGKPIGGASVQACVQGDEVAVQDCTKSVRGATDADGHFHLERIPKFEWLYVVVGDYFYGYFVNADYEGTRLTSLVRRFPRMFPIARISTAWRRLLEAAVGLHDDTPMGAKRRYWNLMMLRRFSDLSAISATFALRSIAWASDAPTPCSELVDRSVRSNAVQLFDAVAPYLAEKRELDATLLMIEGQIRGMSDLALLRDRSGLDPSGSDRPGADFQPIADSRPTTCFQFARMPYGVTGYPAHGREQGDRRHRRHDPKY
jgi:hypothetical protein